MLLLHVSGFQNRKRRELPPTEIAIPILLRWGEVGHEYGNWVSSVADIVTNRQRGEVSDLEPFQRWVMVEGIVSASKGTSEFIYKLLDSVLLFNFVICSFGYNVRVDLAQFHNWN